MAIRAKDAAKKLSQLIKEVNEDQLPVEIVTKHGSAVLVPINEWNSLRETGHLLGSPANAERLQRSLNRTRQP
ncbi:type II toxin-antitoxin system prevent-host-death family antitoxin [Rhodococcus sp. 008]|uniref:type II toxin-antitoxin system Phd/YefM family antitoxin n=1 Tax=Rhodococcus sp. 008 TaxID=1723645 RepID=UPI0009F60E34